jgi:hypothetical protein
MTSENIKCREMVELLPYSRLKDERPLTRLFPHPIFSS